MKSIIVLPIAAALFLTQFTHAGAQHRPAAPGAMDWHSLGGQHRSFTVSDAGLIQPGQPCVLKVVWKKPLGPGYSAVSIRNRLAVTMFSDETSDYVIGLDADHGSERWRHRIGPAYLGHYGSQSGPVSTPLLTGSQVIVSISPANTH